MKTIIGAYEDSKMMAAFSEVMRSQIPNDQKENAQWVAEIQEKYELTRLQALDIEINSLIARAQDIYEQVDNVSIILMESPITTARRNESLKRELEPIIERWCNKLDEFNLPYRYKVLG